MYICVLEKFVKLGVPMMPRLEEIADQQTGNFKKLTEVLQSELRGLFWSQTSVNC